MSGLIRKGRPGPIGPETDPTAVGLFWDLYDHHGPGVPPLDGITNLLRDLIRDGRVGDAMLLAMARDRSVHFIERAAKGEPMRPVPAPKPQPPAPPEQKQRQRWRG